MALLQYSSSVYPICYKNIGIPGSPVVPVGAENNFLAISAEHWESIKALVSADFFQS